MRLARFARKTLTPRFTDFFTDFEEKTDCFAVYQFSVGLGQCAGVLLANVPLPRFLEETFS